MDNELIYYLIRVVMFFLCTWSFLNVAVIVYILFRIQIKNMLINQHKENKLTKINFDVNIHELSIVERIDILKKIIYLRKIQWINNLNVGGFCNQLKEDIIALQKSKDGNL